MRLKGTAGDYLVRTSGQVPVDRLRLVFDRDNSLAGVTFFSRKDDKSPWCERGSANFYRLRRGGTLVESDPLEIPPTADRQWLIRLRQSGSGLGKALPMVEFGWQRARLIFTARGEPPYRLAYGSARTEGELLRDDGIAAALATWEKQQIRPLPATVGPSVESGGRKALKQPIPATTWKKALLWAALLLGVAILGRMAWRLGLEMRLDDSRKKTLENE